MQKKVKAEAKRQRRLDRKQAGPEGTQPPIDEMDYWFDEPTSETTD